VLKDLRCGKVGAVSWLSYDPLDDGVYAPSAQSCAQEVIQIKGQADESSLRAAFLPGGQRMSRQGRRSAKSLKGKNELPPGGRKKWYSFQCTKSCRTLQRLPLWMYN
jgi:hypothetical protein